MRVLALDTTTRAGSVAVVDEAGVLFEGRGDAARSHAERLPADLLRALEAARLHLSDIDLFGVVAGPGSFTGLRIGIATIQGLTFVTGKRIVPVAALLALAHGGAIDAPADSIVGAWMDAHRREVFSALYRVRGGAPFTAARLIEVEAPAVGEPRTTVERWRAIRKAPDIVIGDGAILYADVLAGTARALEAPLLASIAGRLAIDCAGRGETVDPAAVQPVYVRRPDAELARDAAARAEQTRRGVSQGRP